MKLQDPGDTFTPPSYGAWKCPCPRAETFTAGFGEGGGWARRLPALPAEGIAKPQWQRLALHPFGLSQTPFYGAGRRLEAAGLVCVQAGVFHRAVQGAQEAGIPEFPKTPSGNQEVPSVSSFPEITVGDQERGKGGQRKRRKKKGRR